MSSTAPNLVLGIQRILDIYGSSTYQDLRRMISDHARARGVEVSFPVNHRVLWWMPSAGVL